MAQYRKSSSQQPLIPLEWNEGTYKSNTMQIFVPNLLIKMRTKPGILALFLLLMVLVMLFLSSNSCLDSVCPSSSTHLRTLSSSTHLRTLSSSPVPSMSLKHVLKDGMGSPIASLSSIPYVPPFISGVGGNKKMSFDQLSNNLDLTFDIKKSDVIVFLHIQKTGGTKFGRHLVRDLILERPCQCKKGKKRCKCVRPSSTNDLSSYESSDVSSSSDRFWLFSRYSMGWKCGLHADWTELTNCVDHAMDESEGLAVPPAHPSELKGGWSPSHRRRYFYITLLRDPIGRFISEWKHVQRGATWKSSRHWCSGRVPTESELPSCYPGQPDWRGVTLDEFMSCHSNLAINRQTRMLADLTLVGCYNRSVMSQSERDTLMLASAKDNLRKMAYFGICENQTISQYLFESTFRLNFKSSFVQLNQTHSTSALANLSDNVMNRIKSVNHLDIQLYEYAWKLLKLRFETMVRMDENFDQNWKRVSSNRTEEGKKEEVLVKGDEWSKLRSSNDSVASVDPVPGIIPGTILRKQVRHDLIRKSSKNHPGLNLIPDTDEDYDQEDTPNYEEWN